METCDHRDRPVALCCGAMTWCQACTAALVYRWVARVGMPAAVAWSQDDDTGSYEPMTDACGKRLDGLALIELACRDAA